MLKARDCIEVTFTKCNPLIYYIKFHFHLSDAQLLNWIPQHFISLRNDSFVRGSHLTTIIDNRLTKALERKGFRLLIPQNL